MLSGPENKMPGGGVIEGRGGGGGAFTNFFSKGTPQKLQMKTFKDYRSELK